MMVVSDIKLAWFEMADKILFVDDDRNILSGFQRTLRGRFTVDIAESGEKALEKLKNDHEFAVIVSDYRMPGMNGVEFLSRAAVHWPTCTRVLLTGEADTKAAGAAVNQGQIFRFLSKPCPPMILEKTLTAALKHHQLISGEKDLLERTLRGSMEALIALLGVGYPNAFRHSQSVYEILRELLRELAVEDKWEFELAGLLLEVGNVTLPNEILTKIGTGEELTAHERDLRSSQTTFAARLLEKAPRLELVAKLIECHGQTVPVIPVFKPLDQIDRFTLGAHLLHLATRWNWFQLKGLPLPAFVVEARASGLPADLIKAVESLSPPPARPTSHSVRTSELNSGMVLDSDLIASSGVILVARGQTLSTVLVESLRRRFEYYGVDEEVSIHNSD